jgi:hypothetical protein
LIEIEWVKQVVRDKTYRYSKHGDQEWQNNDSTLAEVAQALSN